MGQYPAGSIQIGKNGLACFIHRPEIRPDSDAALENRMALRVQKTGAEPIVPFLRDGERQVEDGFPDTAVHITVKAAAQNTTCRQQISLGAMLQRPGAGFTGHPLHLRWCASCWPGLQSLPCPLQPGHPFAAIGGAVPGTGVCPVRWAVTWGFQIRVRPLVTVNPSKPARDHPAPKLLVNQSVRLI